MKDARTPVIAAGKGIMRQGAMQALADLSLKLNFGTVGAGSNVHLAMELFKLMTKTQFVDIAYKGGAPAMTALVAGEIPVTAMSIVPSMPHVKSKRFRRHSGGRQNPFSAVSKSTWIPALRRNDVIHGRWVTLAPPRVSGS